METVWRFLKKLNIELLYDPALLWLWCRPAAAVLIQPLAWELPYAVDVPPQEKDQ